MDIEEIKVRLSNLDAGKVVKYDNTMNLATQYMVDYKRDVEYLLSIIKQAEKALESASKQLRDDQEDMSLEYGSWSKDMEDSDVLKEVKSALKAIRGN